MTDSVGYFVKTSDQMGREVVLSQRPARIISLVPSQTELLFALGLEAEIIGITKFCIYPKEKLKGKAIIGGTKNFRFDLIDELSPDLIIGNKEENYQEGIEQLESKYPVWMSDIHGLSDAIQMITEVGQITGREVEANSIAKKITDRFVKLDRYTNNINPLRVGYLIWKDPYMVAGENTFINDILSKAGFINVFDSKERYPIVDKADLQRVTPDVIMLSSEPYPFKEKHLAELKQICPDASVILVDGEMFSWYGSRLLQSPDYIIDLLKGIRI